MCRRRGLDRTSHYEWKRRFQTEGLKDHRRSTRPIPTPPESVVARIRELALEHPAYGCNRLEAMLALEGMRLSSITIQILNKSGPRHQPLKLCRITIHDLCNTPRR